MEEQDGEAGLALSPVPRGTKRRNQSSALIGIHEDGSISLFKTGLIVLLSPESSVLGEQV